MSGIIPGFSSKNLSTFLIAYGLISSDYNLAATALAIEISSAFFEFLSPMIFKIGNDATSLAIDPAFSVLTEESFSRAVGLVAAGGLVGVIISLPVLAFAENIYPIVYASLKPLIGWILMLVCAYMVSIERGWRKKIFAAAIFLLAGLLGFLVKDSGFVSSDYYLIPIFIGLYGFSSIISRKYDKSESQLVQGISWAEKARLVGFAFIASVFGSFISGMKRGQVSAIALQTSGAFRPEEVLFILPMISLSFATLSVFVLGSAGAVRTTLAFDLQEIVGQPFFSQTLLFSSAIAISAAVSAFILTVFARPLGKIISKINLRYLKAVGFSLGLLLIINFTGLPGLLLAFAATSIGLLSSRLGVRSTHLMGVLLLPSILAMIL